MNILYPWRLFLGHNIVYRFVPWCRGGPSWSVSWSYGSWIYNYLCNQCISPRTLWDRIQLMTRCTRCNITWSSLSVTCRKAVVFFGYSGFLHQYTSWPPRYNPISNSIVNVYYHKIPPKSPWRILSWTYYPPVLCEWKIIHCKHFYNENKIHLISDMK